MDPVGPVDFDQIALQYADAPGVDFEDVLAKLRSGRLRYGHVSAMVHRRQLRESPTIKRTVRVTFAIAYPSYTFVEPFNNMLCMLTRYSRDELLNASLPMLMRPDEPDIVRTDPSRNQFEALRTGKSEIEHVGGSIITKDEQKLEIVDAVVSWNELEQKWQGYADVPAEYLETPAQFETPLDRVPLQAWLAQQQADQIRALSIKVEDLVAGSQGRSQRAEERVEELARFIEEMRVRGGLLTGKEIRAAAREVIEEARYEQEEAVARAQPKQRKTRSDKGTSRTYPSYEFDKKLRDILSGGAVTVEHVRQELTMSRNAVVRYLKRYRKDEDETAARTLRRLGREWYPERYLL
jgi:hypothetical protein